MKFPIMLRSTHDVLFSALKASNDALFSTIEEMAKEISALKSTTSVQSVIITPEKPKIEPKVPSIFHSRGGWRHKAQVLSERTLPKVKDSIAALQERVKREGGVI